MNRTQRLENLSAAFDGELSPQDESTLRAWLQIHPEDVREFDATGDVIRLVRDLPETEPPSNLHSRILRAVAESTPVEVDRETALSWLDDYFDGEISLPQRQVIEHYMVVDPEFAEQAQVHAALVSALRGVADEAPPDDLHARIRAASEHRVKTPRPAARPAPREARARLSHEPPVAAYTLRVGLGPRRIWMVLAASAAAFAFAFHVSRPIHSLWPTPGGSQVAPQPIVAAPQTDPHPLTPAAPAVERSANTSMRQPAAPAAIGPQPVAPSVERRLPPPRREPTAVPSQTAEPARSTLPRRNAAPAPVVQPGTDTQSAVPRNGSSSAVQAPATDPTTRPAQAPVEPGNAGLAAAATDGATSGADGTAELREPGRMVGTSPSIDPDAHRQIEVPPF